MKIIQVMPDFNLAGAETMCENLIYELVRLKHEVVVISLFNTHTAITERLEQAGIKIVYLDKKIGLDFSMISKIKKVLKDEKPDVVHTHRNALQYAMPASIKVGIKKMVHTVHNVAPKENIFFARKLNKRLFKYYGVVPVALSALIKETIEEEYKIERENIPVIFNGIDLSKCISKESYERNGNFKILHIGRFSEQKNHIGLLKAFDLFHQKYSDTELWLIGDGEKRAEIEEYVQKNSLTRNVKFLGLQNNVYQYLHDADIFTLPSNYEGVPMTLIEAMGTGLPIVATSVGGVPDMLDDESAQLVEVSVNQIVAAYEKYYADKLLRQQHGNKAKENSICFSSKTMAIKYERIYCE